jgi:hypothetical protein
MPLIGRRNSEFVPKRDFRPPQGTPVAVRRDRPFKNLRFALRGSSRRFLRSPHHSMTALVTTREICVNRTAQGFSSRHGGRASGHHHYELRGSTGSCRVSGRPSTSILTIALARTRERPSSVENQLRSSAFSIFSIRSWAEPSPRSRSHSCPPVSHTLRRSAMSAA